MLSFLAKLVNMFRKRDAKVRRIALQFEILEDRWVPAVPALTVMPVVSGLAAQYGPISGGTTVTITGTDLTGPNAADVKVFFGSTQAAISGTPSETSITATAPAAGATGAVDVTVMNDDGTSTPTTADLFTYAPATVVSAGNINITGATGTSGTFIIGDTVTATWNNTSTGDNNPDIASVTMDFSQFGGSSDAVAIDNDGTWTASYTIVSGTIETTTAATVSVSATDNAGNTVTTAGPAETVDDEAPVVTVGNIDVTGETGTNGVFIIGDTVTASWNNTAGGDNNPDIATVTMDFSQFGGPSDATAIDTGGTWTATYTITSGTIQTTTAATVAVTATDNAGNVTTTTGPAESVDDVAPVVTAANISISGATGANSTFIVGDTVTATWNDTSSGDNNPDVATVTADFSQFGGSTAVAASNSGGTWTATYTIVAGSIDTTTANVALTATDNAGNATTTQGTNNASVNNIGPVVTAGNISISGATGSSGQYIIGDTITATWNDSATGDNNPDVDIASVTIDFSQFGGSSDVTATDSSGIWTATYTIVAGSNDSTSANVAVTATNTTGNPTTTEGTTNASVDDVVPAVTKVAADSGPTTGGTNVTITGTGFTGATSVSFGSTAAASFTVVSNTQITALAPAGTGKVDVTVANSTDGGTSTTSSADQFTYVLPQTPVPLLSTVQGTVTSGNGTIIAGVTITLTGTTTSGAAVSLSTQTDGSGDYLFSQVQAGTYTLGRTADSFYFQSTSSLGNLGGNSGIDVVTNLTLQTGQTAVNYNFTINYVTLQAVSLADYLSISVDSFTDFYPAGAGSTTGDGSSNPSSGQSFGTGTAVNANVISGTVQIQTSPGTGFAGITVYLTGIDYTGLVITPITTTTTDSSGDFTFNDLNPGTYALELVVPSGDEAVSATAGAQGGGFALFNDEIFDIDVADITTATTYSGYNFVITPQTSTAGATTSGPIITAGLVDTTGAVTADPAVQGIVAPGTDGAAITQLLASVSTSSGVTPTFDITSSLINDNFYLNEANLAQIAGISGGVLPDGTYNVTLEAVDANGMVTTLTLPAFTLTTTTPSVPTVTVQTTNGSVLDTSGNDLGTLVNTIGGEVISNPNNVDPSTAAETIVLTGTNDATTTAVTLYAGSDTSPVKATVTGTTWTADVTLSQAVTDFTIQATNAAGNSSYTTMFVNLSQPLTTTNYSTASSTATNPLNLTVAADTTSAVLNLADGFDDPNASNVIVEMNTSDGPVYIELFAGATPQSVDNFLAYIDSNDYNQAIFSRLVSDFVLQGGEYQLQTNPTSLATITTLSTFNGEVGITSYPSSGSDNVAGTLAMALPSGSSAAGYNDNGGTDQFFFNLTNDSSTGGGNNLDADFAVFGQVLSGADMRIINTLGSASTQDQSGATTAGDLTDVPLVNYSGDAFPTDATASNFEVINLATVLSESDQLSYSVTVSDPSDILTGDTTGSSGFVPFTSTDGQINANDTLGLDINADASGTVYFDVTATNLAGYSVTQTFSVTVGTATTASPIVTTQPNNVSVNQGSNATFTAAADGIPSASVQWQVSTDGGVSFTNISGATTPTLTITDATAADSGNEYQAVFTNTEGSVNSNAAALTVDAITTQPVSESVVEGETATFSAATSNPADVVQWQVSTDGGTTFTPVTGANSDALTLTDVGTAMSGNEYQAVFTNAQGSLTTSAATLTVGVDSITTQPSNQTIIEGQSTTLTAATADPDDTVQWQVSTDGGMSFTNLSDGVDYSGSATPTLTISGDPTLSGNEYQAVFTNTELGTLTTNPATLTVNADTVTTQPGNQTIIEGQSTTLTAATADPEDTVQWQVSTDGGMSFTNLSDGVDYSGSATPTLTINGDPSLSGNEYQAVFTNTVMGTLTTNPATLTVNADTVTMQPTDQTVNAGQDATFMAATADSGDTVQWMVSTDGGMTFSPVSGGTGPTLTITGATAMQSGIYEAVFSNTQAGSLTSNTATLTVDSITTQPTDQSVNAGQTATFTAATSNPGDMVQWMVSTDGGMTFNPVSGGNSPTLTITGAAAAQSGIYEAVFTNAQGTLTTSTATLTVDSITTQPTDQSVNAGQTATFTAATSNPGDMVQWMVSTDGGMTFNPVSGGNSPTLTITGAAAAQSGIYEAVFTNAQGTLTTTTATLTVDSITSQPTDQSVTSGQNTTFTAETSNPGDMVQWQVSTDGGMTFTNLSDTNYYSGSATTTLTITAADSTLNNDQYQAVFTNAQGMLTTSPATLTVT